MALTVPMKLQQVVMNEAGNNIHFVRSVLPQDQPDPSHDPSADLFEKNGNMTITINNLKKEIVDNLQPGHIYNVVIG